MHIRRIQFQMRLPWSANPGGYYYWTNQYYYDLDNPPTPNDSVYWLSIAVNWLSTSVVQENRFRIADPATTDNWIFESVNINQPGNYAMEGGWSPFNTVLMHWKADGKRVGYTRLRFPVPSEEIVSGRLHPDLYSYLDFRANLHLLQAKICSREGEPIDKIEIDPLVRMWQMRHGTKRRERKVFGPP